jgi:hypothetical protein
MAAVPPAGVTAGQVWGWTRDTTAEKEKFNFTPFKLDISNALGIESKRARAILKNYALQNPAGYSAMKDDLYTKVVKAMVENAHLQIWNLLSRGIMPDLQPLKVNGDDWSPHLPDQEIGKLANGFAESMMEAFTDMMDKIFPDDYDKLANDKTMHIAKVKGITAGPTAGDAAV